MARYKNNGTIKLFGMKCFKVVGYLHSLFNKEIA